MAIENNLPEQKILRCREEKFMKMKFTYLLLILCCSTTFAAVATFEDTPLASESHYGGSYSGSTGFVSGDASFNHTDSEDWGWDGFSYSNETDTTTAGWANQHSAYLAESSDGTNQYGVCYVPSWSVTKATISLGAVSGEDYNSTLNGMWITNTTYTYWSMKNGDDFAKKFGGDTGNDQDWLKLTITGIKADGSTSEVPVEFYLADFRFDDNSMDYIIDEWTWVDLSSLGDVVELQFSMDTSDYSYGFPNTPYYFALDNFNSLSTDVPPVPEPASVMLMLSGLFAIRKRK